MISSPPAVPEGFRVIHHRALNDRDSLHKAREAARILGHVNNHFEGDVCWSLENDQYTFYMRHPDKVFDYLKPDALAAGRASGAILTLEDVLAGAPSSERYVFELKVGAGDPFIAVTTFAQRLQDLGCRPDRFVIDGYSRRLLAALRPLQPRLTLTMHMENLWFERAVVTAPRTDFSVRSLERLAWLDALNIRWWGSLARGQYLAGAFKKRGLAFGMSRLSTAERWAFALQAGAGAGYAKTSDLLQWIPRPHP